jgi:PadR family transcriptional regulator, regulatory protein PadR
MVGVQYRKSISEYDIMSNELLRHFFGGFVRMHVLYHAAKEPIWGVEMMAELRRHGYKLGPGTLYPILHHLEKAGYLVSKTIAVSGKRRKNYRITKAGRRVLQDARDKLQELVSEVLEDRDAMHAGEGTKQ